VQQSQENNRRLLRAALPNLAPGYGDSAHDKAADRLARDMDKPVGALLACITDDRQRAMYQAAPDMMALLEESLMYVEECEQFHKPGCRTLSKRIKAALAKGGEA
jgi:hypothetical protein